MIDFTSRQLRGFLLVAQHRSFTRAAGKLFITPSGLSVLIKELENQLGVRLFDRTTREVALTASGTELLTAVQRNLYELDSSFSRVGRTKDALGPLLSLGAPPLWAAGGVTQAVRAFRPRRPELRLQVFESDSATILAKVESGELDMGLGFFFKHVPGIRQNSLCRFSLVLIRATTGRAPSRRMVNWASLKGERFVALKPSLPMQQLVDRHLAKAGIAYQPNVVVNYLQTQIAMAEAGEGVAIVPSFALPECRSRGLMINPLVNPRVHLDFYQIRKAGRKFSSVTEEFTAFLKNYIISWAGKSDQLSKNSDSTW
jgi:DNA-binding transcriptional LysR family regulator